MSMLTEGIRKWPKAPQENAVLKTASQEYDPAGVLAGCLQDFQTADPMTVFQEDVLACLDAFSQALRQSPGYRLYPDLASLSFWCRKSKLQAYQADFLQSTRVQYRHMGLGEVFHITPNNVPLNFMYSAFLGLLSGNQNIVRLPSRSYPQVDVALDLWQKTVEDVAPDLAKYNYFISYPSIETDITQQLSARCDARIIWGGDDSIRGVRQYPVAAHARELCFFNRSSFALLNGPSLENTDDKTLSDLVGRLLQDVTTFDQRACSSPHWLVWFKASDTVKKRFNKMLLQQSSKLLLPYAAAMDKYVTLLNGLCQWGDQFHLQSRLHPLFLVAAPRLAELTHAIRDYEIGLGCLFQTDIDDLTELDRHVARATQTLSYAGFEPTVLADWIQASQLKGVDRIVPLGRALEMELVWDGMDIVRQLSREIRYA